MPSKTHRRKLRDPLVPISGERLDAALERRNISRREAARLLKSQGVDVKPQTLDNLVSGKQRKCRSTVRATLAELTGASEEWLGGGLATWSSDRALHIQMFEDLPRAYLARDRIRRMLKQAWRRDLERGVALVPTYRSRLEAQSEKLFRQYIELAVDRLLSVWWWRQLLLKDGGGWRVSPEDAERFATGLANALEALVGPWFKDRSALDFDRFGQFLATITSAQPRPVALDEVRRYAEAHGEKGERVERQLRMLASVERDMLSGFSLQRPKKQ